MNEDKAARISSAMKATDVIDTYVDTCFLMNEAGRQFLQRERLHAKVICTVKLELENLKDRAEAKAAMRLLESEPDTVEIVKKLSEERDIEKSLADGRPLTADSVFRRLAIRYRSESNNVRFLTADMALAEALSLYGAEILYLSRPDKCVSNWRKLREQRCEDSLNQLRELVQHTDVVLTSSVLKSPYLEQFLLNVESLALPARQLPILHPVSVENCTHLSLKALEMLENGKIIRKNGCETKYPTEQALLDALYYARLSGRSVCMLVSGWDEVAYGYDARSRAAEVEPDDVRFCVLLPWGELSPLLAHKRVRLFAEKIQNKLAPSSEATPEPAALPAQPPVDVVVEKSAPATEPVVSAAPSEQKKKRSLSMEDFAGLAHRYNPKVGVRVRQGSPDTLADELQQLNPDEPEAMIVLGIVSARRQNKPQMVKPLIKAVKSIHPYCLQHWFRTGTGNNSPKRETIFNSDVFFKLTMSIIDKSPNLEPCSGLISQLNSIKPKDPERLKQVLKQVQERGAK